MNKFYIITNSQKDQNLETTKKIRDYLVAQGKECTIQDDIGAGEVLDYKYTNADLIPDDIECVLVLGGDGTMILAARDIVDKDIPLLGVNLGTLGYLAEIDKQAIIPALDSLIKDEYQVEERMMLEGIAYHHQKVIMENIALNDIVIGRYGSLHVINFNLYVNEQYLNSYIADGIIISTATGSTGYNMSAGGPIVAPNASTIIITPICPHTLNTRSIVLSADDKVIIEIGKKRKTYTDEAVAVFDGSQSIRLTSGDRIEIFRSSKKTRILKISKISFLENLRKKMGNN
ncbi:NAD(+)/NADH kinase [Anaerobium acetethylicum]|uniref:NAD kinase n=1 Tax=Anaerobium acetethylicum TaxID=1619234 RepID=A0A1D3TNK2_9FIRM|nr:NAD(+)/NADH kinase [Anaerobium acetethylicum]SCP94897.1 NAD+ kinase [Anaerobium acetethylicum]